MDLTMTGVEELLAHERWARRLARALLRDEDDADDVVQEARIAFWRSGPREPARTRSWLGAVVRNLVRNRARAAARAGATARAQANTAVAPEANAADALAQRMETQRRLATLVMELREPYREVVLLRYYEELTSREIAGRLSVPAGTVRRRLKTGLDELRTRLDGEYKGKREAWMLALVPLGQLEEQRPVFPGRGVKLALSAGIPLGVIALAVGFQWPPAVTATSAAAHFIAESSGGRGSRGSSRPPLPSVPANGAGISAGVVATSDPPRLPGWAQTESLPSRSLGGRVTLAGAPVTGATLRLTSGMFPFAHSLEKHARTDTQGRFSFPSVEPTNWMLTVHAQNLAPELLYVDLREKQPSVRPKPPDGVTDADKLTIDLERCRVAARGVVRDKGGGVIAGATVAVASWGALGGVGVQTDAHGEYQLCVSSRPYPWEGANGTTWTLKTLTATADGYGRVEMALTATQSFTSDFELEPQIVVDGRVVRADNGAPVEGARVSLEPPSKKWFGTKGQLPVQAQAVSNADGRFEMVGIAAGTYFLAATHDDYYGWGFTKLRLPEAGAHRTLDDIKVSPSAIVEGSVRRGGAPVNPARLSFWARTDPARPNDDRDYSTHTSTNEGGTFKARIRMNAVINQMVAHINVGGQTRHVEVVSPKTLVVRQPHVTGVVIDLALDDVDERDTY